MKERDLLALDRYRSQIRDLTESAGEGVNEKNLLLSQKIDELLEKNDVPLEERFKFYQEARNLARLQAAKSAAGNS